MAHGPIPDKPEPNGGEWNGRAPDHVVKPQTPDAKAQFDRILKLCERPSVKVRCRFGGEYWEWMTGPELLERLKTNRSGKLSIDQAVDVDPAAVLPTQ
jgi:hypothetical protein